MFLKLPYINDFVHEPEDTGHSKHAYEYFLNVYLPLLPTLYMFLYILFTI